MTNYIYQSSSGVQTHGPRLLKIEPWLIHITEPLSIYTSPPAHVSTHSSPVFLSLGASVSWCFYIHLYIQLYIHNNCPFYIHTIPIYFFQISTFFFFALALIDPTFSASRFNQVISYVFYRYF